MERLPFDHIVLAERDGAERHFTVEEFMELPIHERIEHILERRVRFFNGVTSIDPSVALRSLRR